MYQTGSRLSALRRLAPNAAKLVRGGAYQRFSCCLSSVDMQHTRQLLKQKEAFIIDCDGVLYHGDHVLPGAKAFIEYLRSHKKKFLFLTNASDRTAKQLSEKFNRLGLGAKPEDFYTSAMATGYFLKSQKQGARAYVIGTDALKQCFAEEGIHVVDRKGAEMSTPDFVVVGETTSNDVYNFNEIQLAVTLVRQGSRLIGTNPDPADAHFNDLIPGTGSLIKPIESVTGMHAYFVGKPNPLMVASALQRLDASRASAIVVGDRMSTDIQAGVEASVDTVLVLSGVTTLEDINKFAFRPSTTLVGVGDIAALATSNGGNSPVSPKEETKV